MTLNGKTVLVVGGSSGIGYAVAEQAIACGARVIVASRSMEKISKALRRLGADATGQQLDMCDAASIQTLWQRVGRIDYLVISAAQISAVAAKGMDLRAAEASLDSKFWGPFRLLREANFGSDGSVVLFSGLASIRPGPASGTLSAINGAIEAFGKAMALELKPTRVNVICPGLVDTEYWEGVPAHIKDAIFADAVRRLPVGRVGTAAEVASATLAVMTNAYINGAVLVVDGGGALV